MSCGQTVFEWQSQSLDATEGFERSNGSLDEQPSLFTWPSSEDARNSSVVALGEGRNPTPRNSEPIHRFPKDTTSVTAGIHHFGRLERERRYRKVSLDVFGEIQLHNVKPCEGEGLSLLNAREHRELSTSL